MADDDWAPAVPSPLAEVVRPEEPAPSPSPQVPGYDDLVEVARGGDSIVFRARQLSLGRAVAIKVVQTQGEDDAARFERELEITVQLGRQHPHIVTVLDTTTTTQGQPCLVMEFHDLGSLHDRLRETGPLPVSDVVDAGTAVADALAFAHSHGVLHRDVKPQNILVLPTSYVLSDFGIARMADAGHTATLERFSYRHASPQVLDGLPPTEADDLWSLGSTLFTLLDGRSPFASPDPDDDTALSYLRRVRLGERRPLTRTDLPTELTGLIDACLQADRESRPASANEALRRLRAIPTEDRSWQPTIPTTTAAATARPVTPAAASAPTASSSAAGTTAAGTPAVPPPPRPTPPAATPAPVEPPTHTEARWAPPATPQPGPVTEATSPAEERKPPTEEHGPVDEPAVVSEVAPSVLAHVARQRPQPPVEAAEHTGLLSTEAQAKAQTETPAGVGAAAPSSRATDTVTPPRPASSARRAVAFLGGALLVGVAIGAGALVMDRMSGSTEGTEPSTPAVIPSSPGPIGTNAPIDIEVSNAALAPVDLVVVDNGTSAHLSWSAPQQDVAHYLVLQVAEGAPPTVVSDLLSPLITEATVEGLDPDAQACFAVVGLSADMTDRGVSSQECRTPVP